MASWFDIIGLIIVAAVFGGTVYGVIVLVEKVSKTVKDTKEQLKTKGYTISDKGLSVKTSGRMTHEEYIDATQRSFINTMNKTKTAASFRTVDDSDGSPRTPNPVSRQNSGASITSISSVSGSTDEGGKKKSLLGRRK